MSASSATRLSTRWSENRAGFWRDSEGCVACLFAMDAGSDTPLRMLMLGQGEDAQVQGRANMLGSFLEDHDLLDHDFAAVHAQVE
jgi:hypothetical protein